MKAGFVSNTDVPQEPEVRVFQGTVVHVCMVFMKWFQVDAGLLTFEHEETSTLYVNCIYIYLYPTRKDINGRLVKNGIVSITSDFGCLFIDDDLNTFYFHCCLTPSLRRERCWKGPTDGSGQGFKDGFSTRTRGPCFLRRGERSMGILHLYIYIYLSLSHYVKKNIYTQQEETGNSVKKGMVSITCEVGCLSIHADL